MTPDEAKAALLAQGFFSKWQGRRLMGGSTYKPGCPGAFEGIRFAITLVGATEYQVDIIDFDNQTRTLPPDPDRSDLGSAVNSVLNVLWDGLDPLDRGRGPNVPLEAALGLAAATPATTEIEALSALFMTDTAQVQKLRDQKALDPNVKPLSDGLSEQQRRSLPTPMAIDPETFQQEAWGPPVTSEAEPQVKSGTAHKPRSYGSGRRPIDAVYARRDFHWAPLEARASWPVRLRPAEPYYVLAEPREMTLVLFVSALRQILDALPKWLELIVFSEEPKDDKVTVCFLASKADPPPGEKPRWLTALT